MGSFDPRTIFGMTLSGGPAAGPYRDEFTDMLNQSALREAELRRDAAAAGTLQPPSPLPPASIDPQAIMSTQLPGAPVGHPGLSQFDQSVMAAGLGGADAWRSGTQQVPPPVAADAPSAFQRSLQASLGAAGPVMGAPSLAPPSDTIREGRRAYAEMAAAADARAQQEQAAAAEAAAAKESAALWADRSARDRAAIMPGYDASRPWATSGAAVTNTAPEPPGFAHGLAEALGLHTDLGKDLVRGGLGAFGVETPGAPAAPAAQRPATIPGPVAPRGATAGSPEMAAEAAAVKARAAAQGRPVAYDDDPGGAWASTDLPGSPPAASDMSTPAGRAKAFGLVDNYTGPRGRGTADAAGFESRAYKMDTSPSDVSMAGIEGRLRAKHALEALNAPSPREALQAKHDATLRDLLDAELVKTQGAMMQDKAKSQSQMLIDAAKAEAEAKNRAPHEHSGVDQIARQRLSAAQAYATLMERRDALAPDDLKRKTADALVANMEAYLGSLK